jgi:hypothetical protein
MPTVTETPVERAFAHCPQPRCPGNAQEPVEAVKRETAHTYRERGGDGPGIESSWVTLAFAHEADVACPHCGHARDVADQQRKTYAALSGHDPMGLLGAPRFDAKKQNEVRQELQSQGVDPEKVALEQQVKDLLARAEKAEAGD